ncbi:helix-turn-helix domain-containing protein [Spirosoma soli]|uniref:Helix-turn-helix domain-containing protein n=1 Tax=Spirosoma soli TaxID=1770529 RepID=A0ABW5MD93_9BACT
MIRLGLFLACWLTAALTWAQIRVEVVKYPALSPTGSGLFMAGDFNNWNPGDPRFSLKRQPNGWYTITLPDTLRRFEYKFTQGNWTLTEGDAQGEGIANRLFDQSTADSPSLIRVEIAGWEQKPAYKFVLTDVPANTPHDASLYITGTFNKWNPGDPRYKLQRQVDGTYRITVHSDAPVMEYKFTRGNWDSVEGRESGKSRPNRVITRLEAGNQDIDITIQSWEDLTSTFQFYSLYDLLMLFSCFQGLLLLIAIPSIQNYNRIANRWLVALLGIASLFVLLKVVSSYRDVAQVYTKLLLVPDFIWFLYAPLFYFYVRRLLFDTGLPARSWVYHFIPIVIQFFVYLPYFLMESKIFQLKIVNQDPTLRAVFLVTGFLALIFNATYWFICRRTIRAYKTHYRTSISYEQNLQYLNTVLLIQAVCLVLWTFLFGLMLASRFITFDVHVLAGQNVDMIWLAFSTITYFLGYVAVHQPEIFKLPQPQLANNPSGGFFEEVVPPLPESPVTAQLAPVTSALSANSDNRPTPVKSAPVVNLAQLQRSVEVYMDEHKPYTNPNLTIHELASGVKLPPHVLSKVINDGFGKNFFDFVNQYRVEELKRRMDDPKSKSYTLLSLAFEVGFNSKTAFNRAFKKLTNQTPKEYFNMVSDEHPL